MVKKLIVFKSLLLVLVFWVPELVQAEAEFRDQVEERVKSLENQVRQLQDQNNEMLKLLRKMSDKPEK